MKNINIIFGWIGSLLIVSAYSFLQLHYINENSILYILMNLSGAIILSISFYNEKTYGPFFLNIFWAGISTIALYGI